jgi:hypothetical protein
MTVAVTATVRVPPVDVAATPRRPTMTNTTAEARRAATAPAVAATTTAGVVRPVTSTIVARGTAARHLAVLAANTPLVRATLKTRTMLVAPLRAATTTPTPTEAAMLVRTMRARHPPDGAPAAPAVVLRSTLSTLLAVTRSLHQRSSRRRDLQVMNDGGKQKRIGIVRSLPRHPFRSLFQRPSS